MLFRKKKDCAEIEEDEKESAEENDSVMSVFRCLDIILQAGSFFGEILGEVLKNIFEPDEDDEDEDDEDEEDED